MRRPVVDEDEAPGTDRLCMANGVCGARVPQPIRSSYSSSKYCASWRRRSASAAIAAPDIESRDLPAQPANAG
ncbi:MAG TPA: hypothetical protein VKD88_08690, partial [Gaiellaceae bacterium]|nr:hypothetical protein [Gaiellaceae bacterium]